jgi:hypothetical protein
MSDRSADVVAGLVIKQGKNGRRSYSVPAKRALAELCRRPGVSVARYTAVANDEHNMLVALVRRPRESLHQLLDRLEQALGPAVDDQIFVDEINGSNRLPRGGFARL